MKRTFQEFNQSAAAVSNGNGTAAHEEIKQNEVPDLYGVEAKRRKIEV